MDRAVADRIEEQVTSAFPEGAIARVQVLEYGDDPGVEPGQTAIRVFIARAGRPEGEEGDKETMEAFPEANRAGVKKLREELPRFIGWVEFRPDGLEGAAGARGPMFKFRLGGRSAAPDEVSEELTPVMTRLGPADLATVDTLITAGIANSRAEVLRWAVGRVRENPAYAQLQERVREISELKTRF
jgi:hypothetical protein